MPADVRQCILLAEEDGGAILTGVRVRNGVRKLSLIDQDEAARSAGKGSREKQRGHD